MASLPPLPLATDVMGKIAAERGAAEEAQLVKPRIQAEIAANLARAYQSSTPKMTPAQQAIELYLDAFKQNPDSARTTLLGLAARKAVQSNAGTSITTSDGTQITFGGTSGIAPMAGPTSEPLDPNKPLTPDEQALAKIGMGPQEPSTIHQLPETQKSRKVAGSTFVNTKTGEVTIQPTQIVTTASEQAILGAQKLGGLLPVFLEGSSRYAGILGKGASLFHGLANGFKISSKETQDHIKKFNYAKDAVVFAATDLMRALNAPNVESLEHQFAKILDARWNETPEGYKWRVKKDFHDIINHFASKNAAAQINGILAGTYNPKTGKRTVVSPIPEEKPTKGQKAISVDELIKRAQGE